MRSRTATALVGLVASLVISAVVYYYTGWFVFFIAIPFVPFLFGGDDRSPVRECPDCGYRTRDPENEYCPRDGTRLE